MSIHTNENHYNIMFQTNQHINIQLDSKYNKILQLINLIKFCYLYMRIKKPYQVHIAKEKVFLTCFSHVEHIINQIIIHMKYIN
jgi:hypothetical protein